MQVEIRPLREEDAHVSVRWRNISDIWRYTKFQATRPVTLDDELAWIRQVTADPTCRRFAILADGRYVGNIYLTGIKDGLAEYHVFIGEQDYWGRGVAKAATREILRFARESLHLDRVELLVNEANAAAMSLYSSFGWQTIAHEGEFLRMELVLSQD